MRTRAQFGMVVFFLAALVAVALPGGSANARCRKMGD